MPKNMLNRAADGFWYGRGGAITIDCNATLEHRQLANKAFEAGARWAMRESAQLSPHIAKFIEMMILLGYLEDDGQLAQDSDAEGSAEESARTSSNSSEQN